MIVGVPAELARPVTRLRFRLRTANNLWLHAVLIVISVLWAIPLLWVLISGFKSTGQQYSSPFAWPQPFDWQNFTGAWSQGDLGSAFLNSGIVVVQTVSVVLVISVPAAYGLACLNLRWTAFWQVLLLGPAFVPAEVTVIPLFIMFTKLGLTNSLEGLVLAECGSCTLAIFLLSQFFRGVPKEIIEAAMLDGASRRRVLRSVILPLSRPALVSVALFIAVLSWNDFFAALVLIQNNTLFTIQLAVNNYSNAYATNYGYQSAALGMAAIPPLLFFLFVQKHFSPSIGVRNGRRS